MSEEPRIGWRRALPSLTSFGIVVLSGVSAALYVCTPRGDVPGMAPGRAVAVGFGSAAGAFVLVLLVTLGVTLAGIADASRRLRDGDKVSAPEWMQTTVRIRLAMVYLLYACLGFALGGTVAGTLQLLSRG